jgi:hypothetical protein
MFVKALFRRTIKLDLLGQLAMPLHADAGKKLFLLAGRILLAL